MKYAIIAALGLAVYSLNQCFPLLASEESAGFLKNAYCRISFFHFIPRRFSPVDFVIHLFVWIVVAIVVWRAYAKYFKGRFF